jgi:hypothetical protein
MTVPAYVEDNHDFGLGVAGAVKAWMRIPQQTVSKQDALPGSARAANGEQRFDSFVADSFFAQSDFAGGVGQGRYVKSDTILSGIGDGRFQGHFFPARLGLTAGDGGSTSYLFTRAGVLYGSTATHFETIVDTPGTTTQYDRTDGTIHCQPIETGAQNVMWVQTDTTRKVGLWTGPSGAFSFVTPTGVTPYVVCPYGRVVYLIGTRTLESSGTLVNSTSRTVAGVDQVNITLSPAPNIGNVLVATMHNDDETLVWAPTGDGWTYAEDKADGTVTRRVAVWFKTVTTTRDASHTFQTTATTDSTITISEWSGLDGSAPYMDSATVADTTTDSSFTSPTLSANTYGLVLSALTLAGNESAASYTNSFLELFDTAIDATARAIVAYKNDTTSTSHGATFSGNATDVAAIVGFRPNAITTDLTQTVFMFTRDDGATWEECFQGDGAGIGVPLAARAFGGSMWVTTANKLYRVTAEEQKFADELQTISLTIDDVDEFSVPFTAASVGHVITTFGGFAYYPVGGTIREHAPGSQVGRQVWPPPDWDTTGAGGEIQGMAAGEGGLFWVAGGYLWCYDGRGFHCLATEPAADMGDTLFWHAGRLYGRGDPVKYWDFKDPSTRPDISYPTTVANFTDGYLVTSYWDAEKVNERKIAREFFLQCEWTAAATSGTLTLSYFIGDTGIHPERVGGGVTSTVTWVDVGTMTVADGNVKTFSLSTPIEFRKIYFRVKIEKGASGYPVVEAVGCNGRVKMPDQLAFTLPIWISTETRDRQGALMYPTATDVREAVVALRALRNPSGTPYYHTFQWTDGISDNTSYTVTVDNLSEILPDFYHDTVLDVKAFVTVTELPG